MQPIAESFRPERCRLIFGELLHPQRGVVKDLRPLDMVEGLFVDACSPGLKVLDAAGEPLILCPVIDRTEEVRHFAACTSERFLA